MFRHGLVEGGVENDDVGQAFENALCGTQAQEVGGVVQRGERDAFFDAGNDFVVNEDGFAVQFAAADDAVADGADAAVEAVGFEFFHQGFDCAGVVGLGRQVDFVFFAVYFECDVGIGQVEFFGKAAEQDFAAAVIQDRAFEGRAAAVQNQD
ncbi:hypothetical protein NEIPOLOT_00920 [Neisseria polysaccharea ATCC 43768]|nr:hypothetical protein NEIPOLOT_00920 [Neisseria polysaccharea ATCC 43768]